MNVIKQIANAFHNIFKCVSRTIRFGEGLQRIMRIKSSLPSGLQIVSLKEITLVTFVVSESIRNRLPSTFVFCQPLIT